MLPARFIILLALLLFGAYSLHQARQNVRNNRLKEGGITSTMAFSITSRDEFMEKAIALSYIPLRENGYPVGSVVVKQGKIIGEGWDKVVTWNDPSAHATVEAIRAACRSMPASSLRGSVIYASAQPCSMCLSMARMVGIDTVFYCLPSRLIKTLNLPYDSGDDNDEFETAPIQRVFEIPMLQEETERILARYYESVSQEKSPQ